MTVGHTVGVHQRTRSRAGLQPVDALRRFLNDGACLLESRTAHPGARFSYVALRPRVELTLGRDHATERRADGPERRLAGDPWRTLADRLDTLPPMPAGPIPFTGGWVGWLSHELGALALHAATATPRPPARPDLPWGHLRLCTDVIAFDHAADTITIIANDLPGEEGAHARVREIESRLLAPAPEAALAPICRDQATASLDAAAFQKGVADLQRFVRDGDCFQVNLTSSTAFPWQEAPTKPALVSLYESYAQANPGAWGGWYDFPGGTLLSSSPELLVDVRAGVLGLRPIAGTRPRGADPASDDANAQDLRTDVKERAEHAMLVDLARNDAVQVCQPGTVHVPDLAGVEYYRHVMHLVSHVEGRVAPDAKPSAILRAVFPGGTVTGAPKRRAVERIAQAEGGPRGPYTGTLGYVSFTGATQWNLLIRTLVATPTHLIAHAGCGIVEGSVPARESAELSSKAKAQIDAALGRATPAPAWLACGRVEPGPPWTPSAVPHVSTKARVLLVDFEDSFVHNLADYVRRAGAHAHVVSAHDAVSAGWTDAPTHVILSPGPGRPQDFPTIPDHLARARRAGVPVLGVCLGHQALAAHAGASITRHPVTVHGRSTPVAKTAAAQTDSLLRGWTGARAGRYHSLVATGLPSTLVPLASLDDGTCMAFRYDDRPWWGIQFHPESLLTEDGAHIVSAFLGVTPHA